MGFTDFTLGPSGEQDGKPVAGDAASARRWKRTLAVAAAAAGVAITVRRLRRRRDESGFTRIEIEGESAAVGRS